MLPMQVEISLCDGVGIETTIGTARREALRPRRVAYPAVDHHLRDVNILRLKLARHALYQTGQT
jgi:hypothetical protein